MNCHIACPQQELNPSSLTIRVEQGKYSWPSRRWSWRRVHTLKGVWMKGIPREKLSHPGNSEIHSMGDRDTQRGRFTHGHQQIMDRKMTFSPR